MPDTRTRRQKLEAVIAPGSGATEGERANARSLLAKMKPERERRNIRVDYAPPTGPAARPAGRQATSRVYGTTDWPAFDGSFDFDGDFFKAEFFTADARDASPLDEVLRKAKAQEALRREGFTFPSDAGFEAEFTHRAGEASDLFRRASEAASQRASDDMLREVRDRLSKMSTEEVREWLRRFEET
ncbi:MAG TPA: hypothetical protein VFX15_03075 [Actinomycetes bacterium]|nr:hypothetical protein [Actinomycetes bacterium]